MQCKGCLKTPKPGRSRAPRLLREAGLRCLCLAAWGGLLFVAGPVPGQVLQDDFADRMVVTTARGSLNGNTATATREPGEPRHGGKTGGHSLWISWIAPTNGVARFETEGSLFDTLLSVYSFTSTNDSTFDQLVEVARADDSEGFGFESETKFGVLAGQRYEIAVDGYFGASGDVEVNWDFEPVSQPPPIILSSPPDRSVNLGDSLTLTVGLANQANGRYRWYFNGREMHDERSPVLVIPSVQATNVGRYRLNVDIEGPNYYSVPTEIQINSDGAATSLAQDKLPDSFASALSSSDGGGGLPGPGFQAANIGVSRGYNGTQIFNTTYSTPDPAEPMHCGLAGGATYWYAYQPPADGTLLLDTVGSTYDTFLAVYTYDSPFIDYSGLIPISCDDNGAGTNGAARLEFAAPKSRQFLVVVDGIDGARGIAHLNYRLDTNRPPVPPTLLATPAPRTVVNGADVNLRPEVAGSPPLRFHWRRGASLLDGETNAFLQLAKVAPVQSGDYVVSVSSHVGAALEVSLPLRVLVPPRIDLTPLPDGSPQLAFPGVSGCRYVIEETDSLDHPWQSFPYVFTGDGSLIVFTNSSGRGTRFFRVRVE